MSRQINQKTVISSLRNIQIQKTAKNNFKIQKIFEKGQTLVENLFFLNERTLYSYQCLTNGKVLQVSRQDYQESIKSIEDREKERFKKIWRLFPIFRPFSSFNKLDYLYPYFKQKCLTEGEYLFKIDDPISMFYVVLTGEIKLLKYWDEKTENFSLKTHQPKKMPTNSIEILNKKFLREQSSKKGIKFTRKICAPYLLNNMTLRTVNKQKNKKNSQTWRFDAIVSQGPVRVLSLSRKTILNLMTKFNTKFERELKELRQKEKEMDLIALSKQNKQLIMGSANNRTPHDSNKRVPIHDRVRPDFTKVKTQLDLSDLAMFNSTSPKYEFSKNYLSSSIYKDKGSFQLPIDQSYRLMLQEKQK